MPEKLLSELLDLPDRVRKGDFVLNLAQGVTQPEKTLEHYVVTPQLATSFDDALDFVRSAVETASSKACYLHGSFGAGKSHFMAVLHLLLEHHPGVRNLPALAPLCARHAWVETKKFLLVPYHMIGARNMESAILGGYVDYIRQHHPTAPWPGVYLADEIFANARQHRELLGDAKFFEQLNRGRSAESGAGWGKLAGGWDAARFEAALKAPPASDDRTRLVGDLVQHLFPAFKGVAQGMDEAYVDLDLGLAVLSAHAQSLGYDGLILFLDELILWLASHSADLNFVQTQGNKLAKLVESRRADRPVPIVSFVARQRDLRELIGDNVTGAEQLNFSDILGHWEDRFHKITLEDRNLPLIAKERVLKPKNDACRLELADAFEKAAQVRQEILEILLTHDADRATFKLVYPFSPALIQALVAVSSALQRERTALKIMLQLLVDRRQTLRLGDVIPLGDLWDVVAHGDEAFTDVMRVNFQNAKKLYQEKLLPMLERQYGLDLEVDRPRAESDPEVAERLRLFQNDDRLIKSLLLSALVHGVEALQDMTCLRLAALNHGTIRSRISNREHQVVAHKFRTWVDESGGAIRLSGDSTNPTVTLQLSAVDTEAIIDKARAYDNPGTRQYKLRQLLIQSLGVPEQDEMFISHTFSWRGTKRSCDLLFTNVRKLPDDSLRSGSDWKLIIDFPFDEEGHSPIEDVDRLERFREGNESPRTLVWIPAFFSNRIQTELGRLVIIERLLLGNNLDQHAEHLSLQDRQTARLLLENQKSALAQRIQAAVEAAYAIRSEPTPGTLDAAYDMSELHFQSLYPSLNLQRPVGATLGEALQHLLDQALSHQLPKHPRFGQEVKLGKDLRQVLDVCQHAAHTQDGRVYVEDKAIRQKLIHLANPLELGKIESVDKTHFVLDNTWKNHFNRKLTQSGQTNPTVADLRRWMDEPEERGLPKEIQNLLILVYADQTNRSFVRYGGDFTPSLDDLPNDVELHEQTLPANDEWNTALARIAEIFGPKLSSLLNAANLATFAAKVQETLTAYQTDANDLPDRLELVLGQLAVSQAEIARSDRVRTARAVKKLLGACANQPPTPLVRAIALAQLETNATSMGRSLKSAADVLGCLRTTRWDLFSAVAKSPDERRTEAQLLLADVRTWLQTDEHALAGGLAAKLSEAEGRAIRLLTPPAPASPGPAAAGPASPGATPSGPETTQAPLPPVPGPPSTEPPSGSPGMPRRTMAQGKGERLSTAAWQALAAKLDEQLGQNPRYRLTIEWVLEEES